MDIIIGFGWGLVWFLAVSFGLMMLCAAFGVKDGNSLVGLGLISFIIIGIFLLWRSFESGDESLLYFSITGGYALAVVAASYILIKSGRADQKQREEEKKREEYRLAALTPAQREKEFLESQRRSAEHAAQIAENILKEAYGDRVPALICPHCQTKGMVRRSDKIRVAKTRVNSIPGKIVGLGTNTEKAVKQLQCDKCAMVWDVE